MKVKFLGQSCFYVEYNGKKLLFDPFIKQNPLLDGFDLSSIQPDYILISHAHNDHIADVEEIAKASGAIIISNYEIVTWFQEHKGLKGHPMNHGGKWKFDFGTVKYVNSVHSSTLPDGSTGGNAGGFVIWGGDKTFYFAGDTALTMDMKLIPMTCPELDVAILPIGDNFTMGYEDAVIAAKFVACKNIIACHFDTFGFIKINHDEVECAFELANLNLTIPKILEEISI